MRGSSPAYLLYPYSMSKIKNQEMNESAKTVLQEKTYRMLRRLKYPWLVCRCSDCMDGGNRFNEYERWICLLESLLGEEYKVLEEGMPGRNTVFPDPIYEENFCGIDVLAPILMTHQPVDLLIIMLGTNDCRDMFNANPDLIARGMERLA